MARLRKAGSADYRGKLNAAGSYLLDQIKGTGSKYQSYREIDEVFPEKLTRDNADETLLALAPRTPITGIDGFLNMPIGGEAILDSKGRVNLDQIPFNPNELSHTAPDAVNSDTDPLLGAFLNPDAVNAKDLDGNPSLARAVNLGKAMSANDTEAYRRAGMPVEVTDEAAKYLAGMFTKGKNNTPLRSSGFVKAGGLGKKERAQILIPGTDTRFVDASKDQQARYMDDRNVAFVKQWLGQGGASIGNVRPTIVAPGRNSHMDHVQALSSSIDTIGADGWGYSDAPSNFSYLDEEANVHAKLNYSLQGQYRMMKLADEMRKQGRAFPPRLTDKQLSDPNRVRLADEAGAIRMATAKASGVTEAGENLLTLMQMFPDYI